MGLLLAVTRGRAVPGCAVLILTWSTAPGAVTAVAVALSAPVAAVDLAVIGLIGPLGA
jgi:hypothetical protein